MIERDKGPAKAYGFLVAIDPQNHVDLEQIIFKLQDAVSWYEGTGKCEVECLGPLDVYPEPTAEVERLENEGGPVIVNEKDINE